MRMEWNAPERWILREQIGSALLALSLAAMAGLALTGLWQVALFIVGTEMLWQLTTRDEGFVRRLAFALGRSAIWVVFGLILLK